MKHNDYFANSSRVCAPGLVIGCFLLVGAIGCYGQGIDPHQQILDKLTAIEGRLTTIESQLEQADSPVVQWTSRLCFKLPVDVTLNYRSKAEGQGSFVGSLGARVFGSGPEGGAKITGKVEFFVATRGGGGLEITWCGPQQPLGPASPSTAGTQTASVLPDEITRAADSLGLNEANASEVLSLLTDFEAALNPLAMLSDGETDLSKLGRVAPLPTKLRAGLPNGSALVKQIASHMDPCKDPSLPASLKAELATICNLGSKAPDKLWNATQVTINKLSADMKAVKKDINQIYAWVQQIFKRLL